MPLVRILLPLLFLGSLLFAVERKAADQPRALEVLFFGDDGHHRPLDRYAIFKEVAGNRGIHLTYEKRMEALTRENLAKYDALLVYANHQEITPDQLAAVKGFVEDGGGFVPVHCGSACFKKTDGYIQLVGGQIEGHGDGVFTADVVAPDHPAMKGYQPFETWDETYRHHRLSDDITVLQRHGEEPWTWVRQQGKGRVFYTAHGHDERCWKQEGFHDLLERGIRWAVGENVPLLDLPELKYEVPMLPARYETKLPVPKIQQPLSPAESMKRAQVPPGFELSLYASEPEIENPIAIAWDHRDRLWVVEALDYPNSLQTPGNDRVKICEDTDGDGKADKFTVFADQLSIATSVVCVTDGAIVTSGPQVLLLKDTDGDGRADQRTVLLDGFKTYDTHAGVSNLRQGFDGWIYGTVGYAGFDGTVGGQPVKFDTGVFRFLPDGSRLEFLGKTTNNTWGLGFTESFDVLGSTANRQASWQVIGDHGPVHRADKGTRVFPTTLDVQGSDGWEPPVELLGDGRIRAKSRHYTAASGHGVYTADRFPAEWRDKAAFVCEPTGHLVSIGWLRTENADFAADFDGNNLYASSDAWSAPVAAETGPDGAVWIADWYKIIVQHNRPGAPFEQTKVERGKGAAYVTPLRDKRMGRIYRVTPIYNFNRIIFRVEGKNEPPSHPKYEEPKLEPLDPANPDSLLKGLSDPSLVRRLHAQRLIVEKGSGDLVPELVRRSRNIHALYALNNLGFFSQESGKRVTLLRDIYQASPTSGSRRAALAVWPASEPPYAFNPDYESDPFIVREWLLQAARSAPDEALGRKLRDWHRSRQELRRGVVLDRCYAAAAARHSEGFLLASLETPPDPSVLKERIYPAAIHACTETRPAAVLARLQTDDSPLAKALKEALAAKAVAKKHTPPADQLTRGEAIYARTCAACHQSNGAGVDTAFPPLDASQIATGDTAASIRIILHGLTGPVEIPGKPVVNSLMPPVAGLNDADIADVLTYVRHSWTNDAAPVRVDEVTKVRAATKDRNAPWTMKELR
ncbi:ThuA domain-containing protein [Luteolibacter flavescens]|uniref:ThuA domain-containing protein n=1 Tax=Luteolibacter flavescens TaxID=1859460 RepID=A0ABT3FLH9_9BACT|nr:PVC-type heme-binding CxxCH protein [Luteolibacter flavescens]MCW1884204.1 ThuA domain-containing protein [Luteolibacter flavescens]